MDFFEIIKFTSIIIFVGLAMAWVAEKLSDLFKD